MIDKDLLKELAEDYSRNGNERRKIISISNDILFKAKKAIFAIQKMDEKSAEGWFKEMEEAFLDLEKRFGADRLTREGAFKAAAEEYMEGKTLWQAVRGKKIQAVKGLEFDYESYLGGLCDMIGELVRYATNQAAAGKFAAVAKTKKIAEETMEQLADFDMTGYLRTKYDQARGHLRKLEQMAYEIRLRGKR